MFVFHERWRCLRFPLAHFITMPHCDIPMITGFPGSNSNPILQTVANTKIYQKACVLSSKSRVEPLWSWFSREDIGLNPYMTSPFTLSNWVVVFFVIEPWIEWLLSLIFDVSSPNVFRSASWVKLYSGIRVSANIYRLYTKQVPKQHWLAATP